jgi:hypothetical protein
LNRLSCLLVIEEDEQELPRLPVVHRLTQLTLRFLPDLSSLQYLLLATPRLYKLTVTETVFIALCNHEEESTPLTIQLGQLIRHLSIEQCTEELSEKNVARLASIFTRIHYLNIQLHFETAVDGTLILLTKYFKNLVAFSVWGTTTDKMRASPLLWLVENTCVKERKQQMMAICDEKEFQVWL